MSISITVYVVRHKPSGGLLPAPRGRMGRGGSHTEPVHFNGSKETFPRFFPTAKNAKNCLAAWLHGKVVAYRYSSGPHDYDYDEDIDVIPQPNRRKEDMEVIPVTITLS